VLDRFRVSRALERLLPSPLPIEDGLLRESCFGVVLRQQLWLCGHCFGELCLQHPGHLLVHLLPGALEQRRIGRVLDQGMFEAVGSTWKPAPLIEQLGRH
jgi:hypothetical protein